MHDISIAVDTEYLGQSEPNDNKYAFAYTITISNNSERGVQLISRHWIIKDGNNDVEEVHGEGVVGKKPHIPPGESFTYTSGALVSTPVGLMEGAYDFVDAENNLFLVEIPQFHLSVKASLH